MVNEHLTENGLIVLTCTSTTLPTDISVGYENVRIRPYIPLPLKYKNYHQYGDIAKVCKNEKICGNFSNNFHLNEEIKENVLCK